MNIPKKILKMIKIPIDKKNGKFFGIIIGIKYKKNSIKKVFILMNLNFSNSFKNLRSNTLEIKDKEITMHNTTTDILVSKYPKKNEDKKITNEKFMAISSPSINGRKSFKLKLPFFSEVFIFV